MNSRSWQPLIALLLLAIGGVMVFQNCAPDVHLASLPETYQEEIITPFKAVICPDFQGQAASFTKFLFAIDMSGSNVGAFGPKPGLAGSYWFENGSDIDGARFAAIRKFMQDCASASTNRFAFIGFAGSSGVITSSDPTQMLCDTQFLTATDALKVLQNFENAQIAFKQHMRRYLNRPYDGEPIPGVMQGGTSYDKALTCMNSILTNDLIGNLPATNETYQFFYISDGNPKDKRGTGCDALPAAQRDACYRQQIHDGVTYLGQLAIAGQRDLRLTVVGYGNAEASFATYLDYMAGEFDGSKAALLDNFADNPDAFCSLLSAKAAIEFRPDFAKALNLTTIRRNNDWQPDSDMDGLTDAEELTYGSDPTAPRSLVPGVMDGTCKTFGDQAACLAKRNQVAAGCDQAVDPNRLVSECDERILGLPGKAIGKAWGVDSDSDGLPDYVEIIKGLNPALNDMNLDPDADGRSNLNEIMLGSDPFISDSSIVLNDLNSVFNRFVGKSKLDPSCTNGGAWEMSLERLFGSNTIANLATAQPINHDPGHQVAFIFFTRSPVNVDNLPTDYYFNLSRFSVTDSTQLQNGVLNHLIVLTPIDANPVLSNSFKLMSGP